MKSHSEGDFQRLCFVFFLLCFYFLIEVIGGACSRSLVLFADAGHLVMDIFTVGVSLIAIWISKKKPTSIFYGRVQVFAPLFNGISLIIASLWIFGLACYRVFHLQQVEVIGLWVAGVGFFGVLINGFCIWFLSQGRKTQSLNSKSVLLHLLTDVLSTMIAMLSGLVIWRFHILWLDPILSIVMSGFIFYQATKLTMHCKALI